MSDIKPLSIISNNYIDIPEILVHHSLVQKTENNVTIDLEEYNRLKKLEKQYLEILPLDSMILPSIMKESVFGGNDVTQDKRKINEIKRKYNKLLTEYNAVCKSAKIMDDTNIELQSQIKSLKELPIKSSTKHEEIIKELRGELSKAFMVIEDQHKEIINIRNENERMNKMIPNNNIKTVFNTDEYDDMVFNIQSQLNNLRSTSNDIHNLRYNKY